MEGQVLFGLLVLGALIYFAAKQPKDKPDGRYVVYTKSELDAAASTNQPAKSKSSNGCLWIIGIVVVIYFIGQLGDNNSSSSDYQPAVPEFRQPEPSTSTPRDNSCRISTTTWAAVSEEDFDRMVKYSVRKESDLIANMLLSGRLVQLEAGTKVYLEDAGFAQHEIRLPGTEGTLWVVAEHVKCN